MATYLDNDLFNLVINLYNVLGNYCNLFKFFLNLLFVMLLQTEYR